MKRINTLSLNRETKTVIYYANLLIKVQTKAKGEEFQKVLENLNKIVGVTNEELGTVYFQAVDWAALNHNDRKRCIGQYIHQAIAVKV